MVHDAVAKFSRTLENHVSKVSVMKSTTLTNIDMADSEVYLPRQSIYLGRMTKSSLQKLLNEGEISERSYNTILLAAQAYFRASFQYVLKKFPISYELLQHAKWGSVQFSLTKFKGVSLISGIKADAVYD